MYLITLNEALFKEIIRYLNLQKGNLFPEKCNLDTDMSQKCHLCLKNLNFFQKISIFSSKIYTYTFLEFLSPCLEVAVAVGKLLLKCKKNLRYFIYRALKYHKFGDICTLKVMFLKVTFRYRFSSKSNMLPTNNVLHWTNHKQQPFPLCPPMAPTFCTYIAFLDL